MTQKHYNIWKILLFKQLNPTGNELNFRISLNNFITLFSSKGKAPTSCLVSPSPLQGTGRQRRLLSVPDSQANIFRGRGIRKNFHQITWNGTFPSVCVIVISALLCLSYIWLCNKRLYNPWCFRLAGQKTQMPLCRYRPTGRHVNDSLRHCCNTVSMSSVKARRHLHKC